MKQKILVGYEAEVAEEARVPLFHMILTGITQHGKTEELKRVVTEAHELGFTILILDVKNKPKGETRDFAGFGTEIPIYLAGLADTLAIFGLLESHSGLPLRRELPELARACKRGKTLKGAYEILKTILTKEKIHPVTKDRVEILVLVLEGLIDEMEKAKPSSKLKLKKGQINVMNLTGWSSGFKQLAVNDAVTFIRGHIPKSIIVFDEAHQFIPEGYGSGSKRTVTSAIKEGAGSQQYIFVADQTIKEVDKDVIAQIPIKIYGGQPGAKLRAKETLDHLPVKTWRDQKISADFIMQLKTGFFLLGERDRTRLVYTLPLWMPPALGRMVAEGKCLPEIAKEICFEPGQVPAFKRIDRSILSDSKDWKSEYEDLKGDWEEQRRKISELNEKLEGTEDAMRGLREKIEDLRTLEEWKEKYGPAFEKSEGRIGELEEEVRRLKKEGKKTDAIIQTKKEKIQSMEKELEGWTEFKKVFATILPAQTQLPEKKPGPGKIIVTTEQPILAVETLRHTLHLKAKNLEGKIAIIYAEGLLKEKFRVADVVRAFQRHGWPRDPRISIALSKFANWGYFGIIKEGKKTEYQIILSPSQARKQGLLKETEKII